MLDKMANLSLSQHNSWQELAELEFLNLLISKSLKAYCKEIPTNKDTNKIFNIKEKCTRALNFTSINLNLAQPTKHWCPVHISINNRIHKLKRKFFVMRAAKLKPKQEILQQTLPPMFKPIFLNNLSIYQTLMKGKENYRKNSVKYSTASYQRRLQLLNQLVSEINHWWKTL